MGSTMAREIDRPIPMPPVLVVKKGSNRRSTVAGSRPVPESFTATSTLPVSVVPERIVNYRGRSAATAIASMPLTTRLMITC